MCNYWDCNSYFTLTLLTIFISASIFAYISFCYQITDESVVHLSANGTLERFVARACTGLTDKCERFLTFLFLTIPEYRTTKKKSLTSAEHDFNYLRNLPQMFCLLPSSPQRVVLVRH